MTAGWLFLFGLLHGLQPDHAVAASALSARQGASAWRAAARLAGGHGAAMLLLAWLASRLPQRWFERLEASASVVGGVALAATGLLLLLQAIRSRYVLHAHAHHHGPRRHDHVHTHPVEEVARHEHGHLGSALGVGFLLGIAGTRSLVTVLPNIGGGSSVLLNLVLYVGGIGAGAVLTAGLIDVARARLLGARRLLDVASGLGALWFGARLVWIG